MHLIYTYQFETFGKLRREATMTDIAICLRVSQRISGLFSVVNATYDEWIESGFDRTS